MWGRAVSKLGIMQQSLFGVRARGNLLSCNGLCLCLLYHLLILPLVFRYCLSILGDFYLSFGYSFDWKHSEVRLLASVSVA